MNAQSSSETVLNDPHRWRERAVALAAVALPIVVLFGPALFSDRLFAMRDAGHYYFPLFKWCADEWGAGRLPLWNPLENCGTAIHADPTASVWYPGKLIFALPLDFSVNYKLYIVGHVALCALAAYWLARRWGASRYAAAFAAMSYSCGGSVVFQHANVVYLVGAAWLPIAVGLIDDIMRQQRRLSAVWLGIVLALIVLGGDPQMAYHVLLIGGLYAVLMGLTKRGESVGEKTPNWLRGALLGASAVVAFALAAVQILPAAEAAATSERAKTDAPRSLWELASQISSGQCDWSQGTSGLFGQPKHESHADTVYDFSVAPWRFAELVWPNCGGRMYPTHRRWFSLLPEESRIWSPSLYVGLLPMLLGLVAFNLRAPETRTRWLSWTLFLFTLGSLGRFGLGWIARHIWLALGGSDADVQWGDSVGGIYWLFVVLLPKYVYFRYPAKLLVVASLAVSLLAAQGWDRLHTGSKSRLGMVLLVLGLGSGLASLSVIVASEFVVLGDGQVSDAFGPFDSRGAWTDVVTSLPHAALVSLTAYWVISKGVIGGAAGSDDGQARSWRAALLVLCSVELAVANSWLTPTAPTRIWREPSVIAQAIASASQPSRCYRATPWLPSTFRVNSSPNRLEELAAWERQSLAGRYALLDRVAMVNAQVGIKRADHETLLDVLNDGHSREASSATLRRLGVEYLIRSAEGRPDPGTVQNVPADRFPVDTALWRITAPPLEESKTVRYRFDSSSLIRGAWISGASWATLLVGITAWQLRRLRRSAERG